MVRVDVNPAVLRWARERAGLNLASLQGRFPKLADWESGSVRPTLRQLETFAKVTRVNRQHIRQCRAEPGRP